MNSAAPLQLAAPLQIPRGRLAVLLPGLGAVATTAIAGTLLARRGLGTPVGSLTQLDPAIAGRVPLAGLEDLVFGGWDIHDVDAHAAAEEAAVLEARDLALVAEEMAKITPMPAVFDATYVRRLQGTHVKDRATKAELVADVRADIREFMKRHECARAVMIWCASTEIYLEPTAVHRSIASFERGLRENDPAISSSQIYAWACIEEGIPFANGAPNLTVDFPAALELARRCGVPLAGKDFKTGQTLVKTVLAPALAARRLGVNGWFSTNILGNRDGAVLDDPASFKTKESSKLGCLESILDAEADPELYGNLFHKVRIEYYPPRGDAKEGWDNIDLFGWLGYPMQIKIDFLCRDSILAAPIVLDLALLLDLAQRAGQSGPQEWLSFYFKAPVTAPENAPVHDLFAQLRELRAALGIMTSR